MKANVRSTIKAHLIRGASYLLLLLAVCVIPFALAQRTTSKGNRPSNFITVTNTNDSGPGSLRQALFDSHDGDTINFDSTLEGQTIFLSTAELLINKNITVSGLGANLLTVARAQNAPAFRIFDLTANHAVTIRDLTINNGYAQKFGCGGGILNSGSTLLVMNCTVSGNSTDGTGGGICVDANATLSIDSSDVSGNYAGDYGGGIANSGTLTINNSTLSGNRGEFAAGAILNGFNGGASLTINNSTLSGNTTQLHGGGIFNEGQGAISNSTLSGNSGMTAGAILNRLATLDIEGTILNRGKSGPNISNDSGTIISHGYNLSSDDGGGVLTGPGDQVNTDPLVGPLQNNGGPTLTHQLLPGSPAIDAGDPSFTPPPFYDQRGPVFWRVRNNRIDVGSFEVQSGTTPSPTPTPTPTPLGCSVTSSGCGGIVVGAPPTDFTVNLSGAADPGTVDASDFTVNGTPASSFVLVNGNTTITFHFNSSPAVQGPNTMHIPACAFDCGNGCVQEFTCIFTYKPSTPTPTPTQPPPSATPTATSTPTSTPRPSSTPRPAPSARSRPTPRPRP